MRTLSDTLARISALQKRQFPQFGMSGIPSRLLSLPEFGSNPGALGAKFYCPHDLPAGSPLVVVLHGCTQNAAGYDHHSGWSELADKAGFALLYPEQQRSNNPNLCFNWFQPADARRGEGEVHSIRQMIKAMVPSHGLDRIAFSSRGCRPRCHGCGHASDISRVFAGGAIIAGLAYGSASTVPEAFDRMRGHGGQGKKTCSICCAEPPRIRGLGPESPSGTGLPTRPSTVPMPSPSPSNGAPCTPVRNPSGTTMERTRDRSG